jgi:hypothetical protein
MKRFAVTAFAVLYGVLITSASAERFNDWITREAPELGLGHSVPSPHSACSGKAGKPETHPGLKRIVQREFVVESPREGVEAPTCSQRHTLLASSKDHVTWTGQPFSSRAPPFQV